MLTRIIYSSTATSTITLESSARLIRSSLIYNREAKITGMLCCTRRHYLQVLEGERLTVGALFYKIWGDSRHRELCLLSAETISEREFPTWEMGYAGLSARTQPIVERYFPDLVIDGSRVDGPTALDLLRELRPYLTDQTNQLLAMNERSPEIRVKAETETPVAGS